MEMGASALRRRLVEKKRSKPELAKGSLLPVRGLDPLCSRNLYPFTILSYHAPYIQGVQTKARSVDLYTQDNNFVI